MRKSVKQIEEKLTVLVRKTRISEILPFKETPGEGRMSHPSEHPRKNDLEASDLFSLFTADIIKEQVTFTR